MPGPQACLFRRCDEWVVSGRDNDKFVCEEGVHRRQRDRPSTLGNGPIHLRLQYTY